MLGHKPQFLSPLNVCVCLCGCVSQADSGFFCEGYSSDDDMLVKEEFRGNIVKQGCLLKQVTGN